MPTLDLVRDRETVAPLPWPPRLPAGVAPSIASSAAPRVEPGEFCLIEKAAASADFSPVDRLLLGSANVIVYDPPFAAQVAAALPLGRYAEPAPSHAGCGGPILFERGLRFARDGWSVVRLTEAPVSARARQQRIRDVAAGLTAAGGGEIGARIIAVAGGARCDIVTTPIGDLAAVLAGLAGGELLAVAFGPFAGRPATHADAFAANGLAG